MGEYTEQFRPVKRRHTKFLDRVIGRKPDLNITSRCPRGSPPAIFYPTGRASRKCLPPQHL